MGMFFCTCAEIAGCTPRRPRRRAAAAAARARELACDPAGVALNSLTAPSLVSISMLRAISSHVLGGSSVVAGPRAMVTAAASSFYDISEIGIDGTTVHFSK